MNEKAKLTVLLVVSFIATGAVVYQLQTRKPPQAVMVGAPGASPVGTPPGPAAPAPAPPAASTTTASAAPAAPAAAAKAPTIDPQQRTRIPQTGWSRNPFLTLEEIDRLNHPEQPVVAAEAPPPKPAAEPALPEHTVTGIIFGGSQGNWAIIDSRTMRAGDRLGSETIAQVKDHSVVLDHQGHTRELPLKTFEESVAGAPTKKEANQ